MRSFSTRKKANQYLHAAFCDYIEQTLIDKAHCSVAIPGGSTPLALFQLLSDRSLDINKKIEWSRVKLFWVDERYVDHDHPQSNFNSAQAHWLFNYVEIDVFPVRTDLVNAKLSAMDYELCLTKELGCNEAGDLNPLDLVLLGMGTDGHVASLFPGSEEMHAQQCVIQSIQPASRQARISMSYDYISKASLIMMPVFGQEKTDLLNSVLDNLSYLPVSRIINSASHIEFINSIE